MQKYSTIVAEAIGIIAASRTPKMQHHNYNYPRDI
jgi:hypothetical protein